MPRKSTIDVEKLLRLFEYQGMITLEQALGIYPDKLVKNTLNRHLKSLMGIRVDRPEGLLSRVDIKRPWIGTGTGASEICYLLTEAGVLALKKATGIRMEAPDPQSEDKSKQHTLALVDIAINIKKNNGQSICNRSVKQKTEKETEIIKLRPDLQFFFETEGESNLIQFIEFEHSRKQEELDTILLNRMRKWDALLSSEECKRYSKDILILFFLDTKDKHTLNDWMKELHNLVVEKSGELPSFNLYFKDFREFIKKPSYSVKDYTQLLPSADPDETKIRLENEQYFKTKAEEIFLPLDDQVATKATSTYLVKQKELLLAMQNYSGRQEFFFTQVCELHEKSLVPNKKGYARAAVPWLSIGLVRQWIEQKQLLVLRERLIVALAEVKAGYLRSLSVASDTLDRVVWESLFPFFNFAIGGPLEFHSTLASNDENKHNTNGIVPVATIKQWDDVCTEEQARKIESAINWLISILLQYPGELGLSKYQKDYMTVLSQSVTATEPATTTRNKRSTKNKTKTVSLETTK